MKCHTCGKRMWFWSKIKTIEHDSLSFNGTRYYHYTKKCFPDYDEWIENFGEDW